MNKAASMCKDCYNNDRKTPKISKEELYKMIDETNNYNEVARMLNVDKDTVIRWHKYYAKEDRENGECRIASENVPSRNILKEEIRNNLDEIMKNININKKYLIYGKDYNISISPINELKSFQSTYINFSLCENVLRIKNNLTNNETLAILKIEIDKMNDKALTNQIEYVI